MYVHKVHVAINYYYKIVLIINIITLSLYKIAHEIKLTKTVVLIVYLGIKVKKIFFHIN